MAARKAQPKLDDVRGLLETLHPQRDITDLQAVRGGFWSAAYCYRADGNDLVLRLGDVPEGFAIDREAYAFAGPDLPIPEVLEIGAGLGLSYAISRRHFGRFLEDVTHDDAPRLAPALGRLLAALRAVPSRPTDAVVWYEPDATTWHEWLLAGLVDQPDRRTAGWRATLAADGPVDRVFRACEARIASLLPACPERRDLVHGDLLHQNVLVSEDAARVTGVFSWKCSARGDFLYDVAWCTFWGAGWHPGIAAADPWRLTQAAADLVPEDLVDAAERHHCYELQIAASHLGWHAWTGNTEERKAVARAAERLLERGPLT